MDAVEFLKAKNRMCENEHCEKCLFRSFCESNFAEQAENAENGVAIVEQWAKEHPVKTRQSEFLTQWPNARLGATGCLMLCPIDVMGREYVSKNIPGCINNGIRCYQCRRDFWLAEIENGEA